MNECLHTVSIENVDLAKNVTQKLYKIMSEAFNISCEFDDEKIPSGEYEILHKVPKDPREIIVGDYNYFVENTAHDWNTIPSTVVTPTNAVPAGTRPPLPPERSCTAHICP